MMRFQLSGSEMMPMESGVLETLSYVFLILVLGMGLAAQRFWLKIGRLDAFYRRFWMLLPAWLIYVSVLAFTGYLSDFESMPPRLAIVLIPAFSFLAYLAVSQRLEALLPSVSLRFLTLVQSFRIGVEIILWMLVEMGSLPAIMSFGGRNFDLIIGLSAPFMAYQLRFSQVQAWFILKMWNIAGILILGTTVLHGILSSPVPFRLFDEGISTGLLMSFPYALLPGFLVPFALACHILSLRKINREEINVEEGALG